MGGHLTAIDRIQFAHLGLDKTVPGFGGHGLATTCLHGVQCGPDHAGIMDDLCAFIFRQKGRSQKRHDIFAIDEAPGFVKEEAAVKVTVPSNAQICAMFAHRGGGIFAVFFQKWIRDAVWKSSVRFVVVAYEVKRNACLRAFVGNRVKAGPGDAIACIHQDLQRLEDAGINKGQNAVRIGRARVFHGACPTGLCGPKFIG